MTAPRKPLSGTLPGGNGVNNNDILDLFDSAEVAADFGPLPKGTYVALAVSGKLEKARTGTEGYTVEFRVIEGKYAGRRLWMTRYITEAAMSYTKRDLVKLGIDSKAKLHQPFPANRLVCELIVVVRKRDDGTEKNEIRDFEVIRVQAPTVDPFAPAGEPGEGADGAGGGVNP